MNNSFSFRRLGLLIRKQWYDNSRLYILSVLALFGLMAFVLLMWGLVDGGNRDEEDSYNIFIVGLFIVGLIFSGLTFSQLGDKAKAIHWLSVPATHFEKLLTGIFYSTILFTLVYAAIFLILQPLTFWLIELQGYKVIPQAEWSGGIFFALYAYFACQALFVLGSVYFARHAIVKTLLFSLIAFSLFLLYVSFLQTTLSADFEHLRFRGFGVVEDARGQPVKVYALSKFVGSFIENFLKYAFVPVFFVATYFRLKEKEI